MPTLIRCPSSLSSVKPISASAVEIDKRIMLCAWTKAICIKDLDIPYLELYTAQELRHSLLP
jgi:hypothetical protein